jgi:hypothetical protein
LDEDFGFLIFDFGVFVNVKVVDSGYRLQAVGRVLAV